jgi:hypothetical protein
LTAQLTTQLNAPMPPHSNSLFLLLFRSAYLSMAFGFAAFTLLGFARLGTAIGLVATVAVALGSEVSFLYGRRNEEVGWKDGRHLV